MKKPYSDATFRVYIDAVLVRCIKYMPSYILPTHITLCAFIIGILGSICIVFSHNILALVLILIGRILDALDGIYAHEKNKQSDSGAFLDIILDFIIYSSVPFAFAVHSPDKNALTASLLIFSFMACGASFLTFAIFAQKQSLESSTYHKKNMYYMRGIVEGAETCLFIALVLLFPSYFSVIGSIFASLCFFTAFQRIYYGYRLLNYSDT